MSSFTLQQQHHVTPRSLCFSGISAGGVSAQDCGNVVLPQGCPLSGFSVTLLLTELPGTSLYMTLGVWDELLSQDK